MYNICTSTKTAKVNQQKYTSQLIIVYDTVHNTPLDPLGLLVNLPKL
jgi:hypothetical protein